MLPLCSRRARVWEDRWCSHCPWLTFYGFLITFTTKQWRFLNYLCLTVQHYLRAIYLLISSLPFICIVQLIFASPVCKCDSCSPDRGMLWRHILDLTRSRWTPRPPRWPPSTRTWPTGPPPPQRRTLRRWGHRRVPCTPSKLPLQGPLPTMGSTSEIVYWHL